MREFLIRTKTLEWAYVFSIFAITIAAGYSFGGWVWAIFMPIFVFGLTAFIWFGLEKLLLR